MESCQLAFSLQPTTKAGLNSNSVKLDQMIQQKMKLALIVQIRLLNWNLVVLDIGR